ncbi:hypothetical protein SAMN05660909_04525 [Chitinophaga terrae (ex Kim and Jung 2007)]|jgi:uncharacterized membrane protein SirB2|uniref:Uncharacterized protein n=1 Tax=Chitinophaga terrae (ex Kim and Jung 2007) TaxID=408074 RepID=A0A1H4FMG8_9BACT|nr:hypothetical protein [Chitinophaga terrae (ex Kim and Jung 2007)]MDQ0108770.1 putative membrane protein SirB2 [Chitinophaga terrae (ex Kim and Jung 2007)]GEP89051.1 hypothetical protein CTE07_06960 [Chitinophaga terrae (ex Kim and Jung 2007)]SEA98257.1 hypothetical protein SAMN05660909_04525 [Chitinophaga terrae (ex Kim and Jung 2007)]
MTNHNKSPHILNTSTNLLGFCLIILTSIKVTGFSAATLIDDFTGIAAILLMASCLLSFLSMRSRRENFSARLELIADYTFLVALVCISITIIFVSFNLMK